MAKDRQPYVLGSQEVAHHNGGTFNVSLKCQRGMTNILKEMGEWYECPGCRRLYRLSVRIDVGEWR
jgi:hypothetical protein